MDLKAAERKWASLHADRPFHDGSFRSWAKEFSDSHPFHFNDGVLVWVSDVDYSPADQFLRSEYAPLPGRVHDQVEDNGGEQ
jgi:hypothetical protein